MRKAITLGLSLIFLVGINSFKFLEGNNPIDKTDFNENFVKIFEAAKNRFASSYGDQDNSFKSEKYTKKYKATLGLKGADVCMVIDHEEIKSYKIEYSFSAATLDEAKAVKKETSEWIKNIIPKDYMSHSSYVAGYAGYMCEFFEFDSEVFAEVSKKPVIRVGIILVEEGKYLLEILVSEPVFKTSDR